MIDLSSDDAAACQRQQTIHSLVSLRRAGWNHANALPRLQILNVNSQSASLSEASCDRKTTD
jgi:hypothetical protein